ncbi:hypothetical protein CR105_08695 [Massilia eurypsychrophila]|jgi:hypothetical protein|uniref:Uncharacterized protein n=1 Tax=Massilia eurypsychrophila TaxID=1485217 RepID=A0A2G8TGV1_9BURK|nr:hypothetical protein [Massilia eurypsychrophila]PIL45254.1 hypothetical protein CR105_08695 [Massilia eurypsychrophila]
MKNVTFSSISTLLEEMGRAFAQAFRYGARAIATMSVPQTIAACIGLALLITILPLAFFLFMVFLIVKLAVAAIVLNARRQKE